MTASLSSRLIPAQRAAGHAALVAMFGARPPASVLAEVERDLYGSTPSSQAAAG